MFLKGVTYHQREDGGDAEVSAEDDEERTHDGYGDGSLGVLGLLAARSDRVEADEAKETGRRARERAGDAEREESAGIVSVRRERPVLEVSVEKP